ncbi:MAG: DsbA family protein [Pseudomonadota bacterium]|nr:DsbA family protein [Pseudomonadota bacterium]
MAEDDFVLSRRTLLVSVWAWAFLHIASKAQSQDSESVDTVSRRLLASAPRIGERSLGSPTAPVVVVEYASATCPHCAQFHIRSWPHIRDEYVDTGKVRWIFREFPLDDLALAAFMLTRCIPEHQYFEAIDALFRTQKRWTESATREELARTMRMAGMDGDAFATCMTRQDLAEAIVDIAKTAQHEFAVQSTPTFFVNGQRVRGAQEFTFFKALLDAELAKEFRQKGR